jgi:hypothetical protein
MAHNEFRTSVVAQKKNFYWYGDKKRLFYWNDFSPYMAEILVFDFSPYMAEILLFHARIGIVPPYQTIPQSCRV